MKSIDMAKKIRASVATVKFWYASWKKEKDAVTASKIRQAIVEAKLLISRAFAAGVEIEDRACIASMNKEISEVENAVGKGVALYAY